MELKRYEHPVQYTGFNGKVKKRMLQFIITKTSIVENFEDFQSFENYKNKIDEMQSSGEEFLGSEDALMMLDIGLLVIKLAYAEVDFENDIVNKSEKTVERFQQSLAYEALMTQILDNPPLILDLIKEITNLIPQDAETQAKISELQAEYIQRTNGQNGNNRGQDTPVTLTPEEIRIANLEKELRVLKGGQQ